MPLPSARFLLVVALCLAGSRVRADEPDESPRLDWERPIFCTWDETGRWVRMQCDPKAAGGPRCLVAENQQANGSDLRRVQYCREGSTDLYEQHRRDGYRMVSAVAESEPGWHRDDQGRVFQVTFDLLKRIYLGVQWAPAFDLSDAGHSLDRIRLDLGMLASWLSFHARNRHTIRALEGFLVLEDLEIEGLLFAYDLSHASTTPLVRITTFFGKPTRHDIYMDVGFGLRLMELHVHPHRIEEVLELEFGELHAAWDIWQSADLYNHLRLSAGLGVGAMWDEHDDARYLLMPNSVLEARFGLDHDGLHYLSGDLHWSMPVWLSGGSAGTTSSRAGTSVAYEVIFLAINDQPLSLRIESGIDYRDDLPEGASKWDASVMAGIRFSFWAPARLHEDLLHAARR